MEVHRQYDLRSKNKKTTLGKTTQTLLLRKLPKTFLKEQQKIKIPWLRKMILTQIKSANQVLTQAVLAPLLVALIKL